MEKPELNENTARVVILAPMVGICHMRVCAIKDATDAEVLEVCNDDNPSGTSNGWGEVIRTGLPSDGGPITCAQDDRRVHLMVSC